jgi:hypothetical protein
MPRAAAGELDDGVRHDLSGSRPGQQREKLLTAAEDHHRPGPAEAECHRESAQVRAPVDEGVCRARDPDRDDREYKGAEAPDCPAARVE